MTRKDVKDFTNAIIMILLFLYSLWAVYEIAGQTVLGVEIEEK